ncbi:MAG TPA: hypothetical protein VHE35_24360 [Kofleriaceae bacterium]|nr:hypothetical protein [Kofleriaceae bacterium]
MTPPAADVVRLTERLARAPAVFLAPLAAGPGGTDLAAVIADLFRDRAARPPAAGVAARFRTDGATPARLRHLQLVLLATWLLADDAFGDVAPDALAALLDERLAALAAVVMPRKFLDDAERREELARTCLAALGRTPAGETATVAEDRLAALDSIRRRDLLREARAREAAREAERARRQKELDALRAQEEEERRQAARTTHED